LVIEFIEIVIEFTEIVIEFTEIHKGHNFSFLTTLFLRSLRSQLCVFALK